MVSIILMQVTLQESNKAKKADTAGRAVDIRSIGNIVAATFPFITFLLPNPCPGSASRAILSRQ